jgi:taurine dehydrogenase small subunit
VVVNDALLDTIAVYNDAWNAQDVAAIERHHHPDIVFENHNAGERVEGREAVSSHIASIFANWPDLRFSGRNLFCGDDFVVSEWTATATHSDGRRLEWDGIDVFPFRDGLIGRKDVYSTSSTPRVLG